MEKIQAEKEFSIGNLINLLITKNELLEMKFTSLISNRNILIISFYDCDKNLITQKNLKFLCNHKNILFDNILLISNLQEEIHEYKIKIFNENISYMKLYIQAFNTINKSENSFSQIFNIDEIRILTKQEINNIFLNKEKKNENLNIIISELEKVNKSLNERKKELDKKEKEIKKIEYNINNQKKEIEQKIIQFKEEILLFKDKCYGECVNEINKKMKNLTKKMTTIENNINNKYKIIKEKINNNNNIKKLNNNNNNILSQEKKEKIANLEIKIKFLEDSINKYKEKNIENEEKIKNYIINEEKLNNNIKKLKDELILTNSQIKEKRLKTNNNNISISNISLIENKENNNISILSTSKNKKVKNKIIYDIDKYQKLLITKNYIYNTLFEFKLISINNFNEKEILTSALLLMHLSTNPIALNNKFDIGHIILLKKLVLNLYLNKINSFIFLLKQNLEDLYNKIPEFKNNISAFTINNNNKNNSYYEFQPLIDIYINEFNLSNIIYNKCYSFANFLSKNNLMNNNNNNYEKKYKIKKFTIISNLLISILFCSSIKAINDIIKQIIAFFVNYNKDEDIINFLSKINLGQLFLLIFEKINLKENPELSQNIFDCILYSISIFKYNNNNIEFFLEQKKFENYLKNNIKEFYELYEEKQILINDNYNGVKNNFVKSIIFITNICILCPNLTNKIEDIFMDNINNIKNILENNKNINKEDKFINLAKKNISLLSKIIYSFN